MTTRQFSRAAMLLLLMLLTTVSAWADGSCGDGVTWSYNGDTKTLTISYSGSGTGAMEGYDPEGAPWNSYKADITTVIIGSGVTSIGSYAFWECSSLTSITIPNSVTSIGYAAFSGCSSLTSITIPNSVTSIGSEAFAFCTGLTSIEIPNSVTSIGGWAFSGCSNLASVTLKRDTPPSLGSSAFDDCTLLNAIYVPSSALTAYQGADNWSAYKGKMQGYDGTCGDNVYYLYDSSTKTLNIFGTGGMWGYNDFMDVPWNSYCDEITTIIIGNGVTHIGNNAFHGCGSLATITIPNSVTSIDFRAFYYCTGLTSVTFGNSVTSIGDDAFWGCTGLTSIEIPASVTSIGSGVFSACTGLASISVASGNTKYHSDGNCLIETATKTLIQGCKNSVIPTGVTSIGRGAFSGCTGLTSIEIPASVTSIGDYAFNGCTSLTSIEIPASVTSIGERAFRECTSLTSVTIYASVTSIDYEAFKSCSALSSVIIYAPSLDFYGTNAFDDNASGRKIYVPMASLGTYQTNWSAYAGDIVGFSGTCGASGHETDVLWAYESGTLNIFRVGSTGDMADYTEGAAPWNSYKGDITKVVIGNGVTSIGNNAFNGCNGLFVLISEAATTPSLGSNALDGCTLLNAIGVPSGTASAYKSATNWADYADIIYAIDGTCGTGVYYAYNSTSETLNIFGSGAMKDYPRDTEELPWNSYGGMSTVVIGNGVTHIGNNAFHGCGSLASITIPNSVTSIGGDAFMSCSSLASITIPNSVTSIGDSAFERCDGLTSVTFGNSVTSIGGDAFMNCSSLASIEIPASVTSIGDRAFESCFSLASISVASGNTKYHSEGNCLIETATNKLIRGCKTSVIPTGVTSIGECAFNGCSALTNIEIPDDVTSIGDDAFSGCTGLTSITFGNSVTSIGDYAFNGCNALTSIEIPASVTSIGDGAFYSCSSLASITIYAPSLTTYGEDAFKNNASGRKIYVPMASLDTYQTNWSAYAGDIVGFNSCGDNVYYAYNSTTHTLKIFGSGDMEDYMTVDDRPWADYCGDITTVVIGNGVTSIGRAAFLNCSALTSVTIPASVTSIGDGAFHSCSALTSITFPANLTSIGDHAFFECTGLTSVTFPANLTSIDDLAFNGCTGLTSITIPANVTSIGNLAFLRGYKLVSIIIIPETPPTLGGYPFDYGDNTHDIIYVPSAALEAYKTADGWKEYADMHKILGYAPCGTSVYYAYDSSTTTLYIVGTGAMESNPWRSSGYYGDITKIVIDNGVTSIVEGAFEGCTSLEEMLLYPTTPPSLGSNALNGCNALNAIYVPSSGAETYKNATNWSDYKDKMQGYDGICGDNVYYAYDSSTTTLRIFGRGAMIDKAVGYDMPWYSHHEDITTVVIGDGVTHIGGSAFTDCTNLTSVEIPNSVTSIGKGAFRGCTGLTSITIPNSVTSIGEYAFASCTGLTSVEIPASVTSIDGAAFEGCDGLTSIEIPASVTSIGNDAFWECSNLASVTIYAPSLTTYGVYAFADNADDRKIYVFSDCVETYKGYATKMADVDEDDILPITLTANKGAEGEYWTTYYNELANAKVPSGAQAFKVTLTGTTLELKEIEDGIISKGEAVVIKSTSDNVLPEYSATGSSDTNDNDLKGTMKRITNPNYGKVYVLNNKSAGIGFYKLSATGAIAAHKAYLEADGTTAPEFFGLDGETTSISEELRVKSEEFAPAAAVYDLQGRRVAQPTKGLYIVNGKKVVIK